jgi:hypothetical protein
MDFLEITGFSVPSGKNIEFQAWVQANSDALGRSLPEGIELVGVYAARFTSQRDAGDYRLILRLDSAAALDRFSDAMKQGKDLTRLMGELWDFADVRLEAGASDELLKSVLDVMIWADHPED